MNYFDAHKLLDEVKDGHEHTTADITVALGLVGDLDPELCGTGLGGWRSSPKGWQESLLDTPV